MIAIFLILFLVALIAYVIYHHNDNSEMYDYNKVWNSFIANDEYLEIKTTNRRGAWPFFVIGALLIVAACFTLFDVSEILFTKDIKEEITVISVGRSGSFKYKTSVGKFSTKELIGAFLVIAVGLFCIYECFRTRWVPPIFVFSEKGLLYAYIYDKKTEVTPILWEDIELVNMSLGDLRIAYWTEDERFRTIVIPYVWIDSSCDNLKQLFTDYNVEVKN